MLVPYSLCQLFQKAHFRLGFPCLSASIKGQGAPWVRGLSYGLWVMTEIKLFIA